MDWSLLHKIAIDVYGASSDKIPYGERRNVEVDFSLEIRKIYDRVTDPRFIEENDPREISIMDRLVIYSVLLNKVRLPLHNDDYKAPLDLFNILFPELPKYTKAKLKLLTKDATLADKLDAFRNLTQFPE